jgi:predicted Zn-dependent peptidase
VAPPKGETRVFLVDRPGAIQSTILAGLAGDPGTAEDRIELDTANMAFGGYFSSRLNLNLREDKGWSYGSRSNFVEATGPRPWILSAPVQTDKTVEALQEIHAEIMRFVGEKPLAEAEFAKVRDREVRAMPGRYESNAAVAGAIAEILVYGRPDDYVSTLKARLESQSLDGVRSAAQRVIDPGHLTWVIVGDLAKIEAPIRALELGAVEVLDSEGRKLR